MLHSLGMVQVPVSLRNARRSKVAGWVVAMAFIVALTGAAQAADYATSSQRAAQWLESQQDVSDGSWPGSSEASTYLQTTEAVLALSQANRRNSAYYAGLAWIKNHAPQNLDTRARRLIALNADQANAQQDIDALLTAVAGPAAGQTGWGLSKRYGASPLDTALALDALRVAGATFDSTSAIAYLKAAQRSASGDQGWASAAESTTDAYATARVIQALAPYKATDASLTTPLANAVATLKTKVNATSPLHLRAAAALAYLRIDPASSAAKTLLDSILATQRGDGGFDAGIFAASVTVQGFSAADGKDAVASRQRVDVTDAALRAAINEALGRGSMDQLNRGELAQLTTLDISNRGVTSLAGLQYATSLTTLNAANNSISDTSPIASLTGLTTNLSGNPCFGCTPVEVASSGDVPLPLWALGMLGAALMGVVGRAGRRGRSDA